MSLKLIPRKGSAFWYLRGTVRGRRVFESTGVDIANRKAAEEVLIIRGRELLELTIHGDRAVRTFAEAALSYLASGGEAACLHPIIRHLGHRKVASIGQADIDECARRLKPNASPATLNRRIYTPISAVLQHAASLDWRGKPKITRPKQSQGRVRWITFAEAERLIDAAAPHLRPLVIFLLATGARLSEALYLDWREVDLMRGHVAFLDTKNGEARGVPLHPRAVAALANLPHRDGVVFRRSLPYVTARGYHRGIGEPYRRRDGEGGGQIKTAWRSMLRRAGISDFSPHDCRHTWATWHYAANRDLGALMQLGGWKTPAMVMRYAHVNTLHLAGGIGRIWGQNGAEDVHTAGDTDVFGGRSIA